MTRMIMVLLAAVALVWTVGCSGEGVKTETDATDATNAGETTMKATEDAPEMKTFTLEELATFNGKDGNPAYVASDGVVYDVTDVPAWKDGEHKGHKAGQDITGLFEKSPHGAKVLEKRKAVGKLAE